MSCPSMVDIHNHESYLRMFAYNVSQLVRRNSHFSHMKISCNDDENVKFFGNKIFNVLLTIFKFCGQNKKICEDQRRRDGHDLWVHIDQLKDKL